MGQYLPEIHTDVDEGSSYLNNTAITVFAPPSCSDTLNKKILQMNENEREQFMLARDNYYYLKKNPKKQKSCVKILLITYLQKYEKCRGDFEYRCPTIRSV